MNRTNIRCIMMFVLSVVFLLCASTLLQAEQARPVLVHYMPWYASESVSGEWGWHWTMNRFNPDKVGKDGRREVASHYYPLIGAYDSNDPHVLECHVLLMKFAGIDGVVIDWYGRDAFRDYGEIHRNTLHLIKYIKRAGLRFAICYEDQAVKHKVQDRSLPEAKAVRNQMTRQSRRHCRRGILFFGMIRMANVGCCLATLCPPCVARRHSKHGRTLPNGR